MESMDGNLFSRRPCQNPCAGRENHHAGESRKWHIVLCNQCAQHHVAWLLASLVVKHRYSNNECLQECLATCLPTNLFTWICQNNRWIVELCVELRNCLPLFGISLGSGPSKDTQERHDRPKFVQAAQSMQQPWLFKGPNEPIKWHLAAIFLKSSWFMMQSSSGWGSRTHQA